MEEKTQKLWVVPTLNTFGKILIFQSQLLLLIFAPMVLAETIRFDGDPAGAAPRFWTPTATGSGQPQWAVATDPSAPSRPNVLKQSGQAAYPLCILDQPLIQDGYVEVRFKPESGQEDQAGGVVWRLQDRNNYYLCRANALENNVRIYHFVGGKRTQFKGANVPVAANEWHTLRVDFSASHFKVKFNGRPLFEAEDNTFMGRGRVGLWTKADSVTLFDDFGFGAVSAGDPKEAARSVQPLPKAHAHNDYEHQRPLLDALEHGFCSVEADVYLVNGQLLVAHDLHQVNGQRTLQALYLDPLQERARANGGRIYRAGPDFILLIDLKSAAGPTYAALKPVLERYSGMLTRFEAGLTATNAVTIIISGNRPTDIVAAESVRYAAIDGRWEDLDGTASPHLMPLISDNWSRLFQWRGDGSSPPLEKERLQEAVSRAHKQGRRIRFWAAPDRAEGWQALNEAGVDLINTDKLAELGQFLRKTP